MQGPHCTGITRKMAKEIPSQGKHRKFGNFTKTQGICFAELQVVHALVLKVKDISIFAAKVSQKNLKLNKSVMCM